MPEVLIRLERPALLTPELRAWLADRMDGGRAVLMTDLRLLGLRPALVSEQLA
jgi:hypothetical protein